jgi:hypoxia up-regulated 1
MKLVIQLCAVLCTLLLAQVNAIVIGIDFGSEFTKVALVMPGQPFQIVLNPQSKRKTETMVSFNEGTRQFGSDAYGLSSRKPKLVVSKMVQMLGRAYNTTEIDQGKEYKSMELLKDDVRGGWSIQLPKVNQEKDVVFSSEELAAMILQFTSFMTKEYVNSKNMIKDCTITVPSYFTQSERQAVLDAAMIADLNVLGLIEENTAAALQFSIDRVYENKTHNVLFYNMGAESTQVSIASFSSDVIKDGFKKNKTVGVFTMVGKGWDQNLGGKALSLTVAESLADQFNKKWGKGEVREAPRAMAKIMKEANKVKSVLSANSEIPTFIEGLHADIDFAGHLTRVQLEALSTDYFSRVTGPIETALASAGMELADVDQVELLGGGVRVPKVKSILSDYFGEMELGVHLNGDEAMAMGAVFHAANESVSFKVRHIGMTDMSPYQVDVRLENLAVDTSESEAEEGDAATEEDAATTEADAETEGEDDADWSKQATIFKAFKNKFGSRKQVAFHHEKDILSTLRYGGDNAEGLQSTMIAVYNITGVTAFKEEMKELVAEAEAGTRNFTSLTV